jgi:hypothetical protein
MCLKWLSRVALDVRCTYIAVDSVNRLLYCYSIDENGKPVLSVRTIGPAEVPSVYVLAQVVLPFELAVPPQVFPGVAVLCIQSDGVDVWQLDYQTLAEVAAATLPGQMDRAQVSEDGKSVFVCGTGDPNGKTVTQLAFLSDF